MTDVETSMDVCGWGKGWTWLVSAFQGRAIAVKAEVGEDFDYSLAKLPEKFRYCHFTNVLFQPPASFAFLPWPEEALGLIAEPGWMYAKELPFLRKPVPEMIEELEKAWKPKEEEPAVSTSTDVRSAAAEARAKTEAVKAMRRGPAGLVR